MSAIDKAKNMCVFTFKTTDLIESKWTAAEVMATEKLEEICRELGILAQSSETALAWLILWGMTYTALELVEGNVLNGRQRYDTQVDGTDLTGVMNMRKDYLENAKATVRSLRPTTNGGSQGGSAFSTLQGSW